jgi:quercetin dioxygenase-like cupin family protein
MQSFPDKIRSLEAFSERFAAFRLRAKSCDVLFATYPAGTRIEPHTHPSDNWGVVTKGSIILTVDGVEQRLGPGDWYHVPPKTLHAARCEVDTEQIEFWFRPPKPARHRRYGRQRPFRGAARAAERGNGRTAD